MSTIKDTKKIEIPDYFKQFPYWLYWFFNKAGGKQGFSYDQGAFVWQGYQTVRLGYDDLKDHWKEAKTKGALGIGFRINQDENFILMDFDDCIDENGNESDFVKDILSKTPPSAYVQYSTSGKGLHIIGHGKIHNENWKRTKVFISENAVEMYDSGRFFVFTGNRHPKFQNSFEKLSNISDLAEYIASKLITPESNGHYQSVLPPLETIDRIPKSQRHSSLLAYAGLCARQGLPQEDAVRYLTTYLVPKFEKDERINDKTIPTLIKKEIEDAYKFCVKKNLASRTQEARIIPDTPIIQSGPKTLTIEEFLATPFSKKEHYLGPFVKQGISLVYAATGVGKTHFSIGVAFSIASGTNFLKWRCEEKAKVLYIDGELPGHYLKGMIEPLYLDLEDKNLTFDIITPDTQTDSLMPNLATEDGQKSIEGAVSKADVIIIDNLSTLVRSGKENEAEFWMPVQSWFLKLRRQGKSVIFVHHAGKGESGSFRGTSKITDAVDLSVFLKSPNGHKAEDGCVFDVSFPKYRHYRKGDATEFQASYTYDDFNQPVWTYKNLDDITSNNVMDLHNSGMKPKEIAEEMGVSLKTVYKWLKESGVDVKQTKPRSRNRRDLQLEDDHF